MCMESVATDGDVASMLSWVTESFLICNAFYCYDLQCILLLPGHRSMSKDLDLSPWEQESRFLVDWLIPDVWPAFDFEVCENSK
jgi:hypothetical protein